MGYAECFIAFLDITLCHADRSRSAMWTSPKLFDLNIRRNYTSGMKEMPTNIWETIYHCSA